VEFRVSSIVLKRGSIVFGVSGVFCGGYFGTIWEKLFFSWNFCGTFDVGYQCVIKINGNFVGITFQNVEKTIGILTNY
jgi:hypothetical protein